jgi:hypothetical protein
MAYTRALLAGDETAQQWLRDRAVETAVDQVRVQTAAARLIFGRDPVHIWLIHGTPIAAACIGPILDRFADLGVTFVGLDEALADPMNHGAPLITARFRNQVQKWAELKHIPIENCPPAILAEIEGVCPTPRMSEHEQMAGMMRRLARTMGAVPDPAGFQIS